MDLQTLYDDGADARVFSNEFVVATAILIDPYHLQIRPHLRAYLFALDVSRVTRNNHGY
jgi:hypothetical protein